MKTIINLFILVAISTSTIFPIKENPAFKIKIYGDGPNMFLIPGATCSGEVWNETVEKYKNDYRIHVFTLAGYGGVEALKSDEILPVIKDELTKYILKHKSENSILIGHSIGGFLGMWMASEDNNLVDKIIIVDALPFLPAVTNPALTEEIARTSFANFKDFYINMDSTTVETNQRMVLQGMIKNSGKIEFVLQQSIKSDKRTMGVTMYELMSRDLRDDIAGITIPTLVLTSFDDSYDTLIGMTESKKQALYQDQFKLWKSSRVKLIGNSRHFIMLDNPVTFFEEIDAFVKEKKMSF
ncbi:MAG: alpha/beta hydrolase [Calditrichaeota bacterium]|nr:MAG: alpha/beta hydrolase [Calditrichota bacterium]MBL1206444.1 alpha/beta hydrolase [Calditrichota bacterium]NOG46271.1 alpha/beta hydrolase [Calditrichota bacterium]